MSQPRPIQSDALFFVTTNIRNRDPIFLNQAYAREAVEMIYRVQDLHPFFLHAFVVMPDHCHFLLYVDKNGSISTIMNRYKMGVSHSIGIGSIWQPRFHVRFPNNGHVAIQYIHNNPVALGLVDAAQNYLWSSASGKWDVIDLDAL